MEQLFNLSCIIFVSVSLLDMILISMLHVMKGDNSESQQKKFVKIFYASFIPFLNVYILLRLTINIVYLIKQKK